MEFERIESMPDLVVITPRAFEDERGYFEETFNEEEFKKNGIDIRWVQDNHSRSKKDVLRGMHWQKEPYAQDKLVRVVRGKVYDVAVDIRKESPTFGKYAIVELSDENHKMFLLPKGFAHGFVALTDEVDFEYKVSNKYDKESERSFVWNDSDVNIVWGVESPILSEKDLQSPMLRDLSDEDIF